MKNSKLWIIIAFLLIIVAIVFMFSQRKQPINSDVTPEKPQNIDIVANPSRYIEYNLSTFDTFKDKRRVLFFYANWCPICKPVDGEFRSDSVKIPEDMLIIRVNYNDSETDSDEKTLAQKYNIVYQHTFVEIDSSGNEITKWNGGGLATLLEKTKK